MLWRMLRGSWRHRRVRLGVATLSMLLGAAMTSALINLSFDVGSQTGRELRAYGANILLLPRGASLTPGGTREGRGIRERDLAALDGIPAVVGYAPSLYLVADVQGRPLAAGGVVFERLQAMSAWWRVTGSWPAAPDEALLGVSAARSLGLAPGDRIAIGYHDAKRELVVAGLVETGGAEDNQVLVPLPVAQALAGQPGQVGLVQVSALVAGQSLVEVAGAIEARLPDIQARPLRQFAQAEESVVAKVRLLLALVAAVVLGVAALAVGSTMFTAVVERRAEIGLMKALGAAERRVAALFLADGIGVGAIGGLGGYAAGLGVAALIGQQVFHATLQPNPLGLPVTLAVATGVALAASIWPVRQALAIDPAVILRGE
ncbi:MAG: ABC transporter permease [Chloroflexi bacterium]|nr:ABC transporter permease [Chloroflexota bacterium]